MRSFGTRLALVAALAAVAVPALAQPTPVDVVWSQPAGAAALAVAFSPDGQAVASGAVRTDDAGRGRVDLWNALSGTLVAGADAHPSAPGGFGPVRALAFRPDGGALATGNGTVTCVADVCTAQDGSLLTWDAAALTPLGGWVDAQDAVRGAAWASGAGGRIAAAMTGGPVRAFDATTVTEVATLAGHPGGARAVATSPDGATVASVGADGMLRVWDAATGALRYAIEHGTATAGGQPVSVAFNADGTLIATAGEGWNVTARVWNAADGTPVRSFETRIYGGPTTAVVAFSPNGRYLLSGIAEEILYADGTTERTAALWFWDLVTGQRAALYRDESAPDAQGVTSVALSSAHDHLVAYTVGATVRVAQVGLSLAQPVVAEGVFALVPTALPQDLPYKAVAPADMDGDGDLDLLVILGDSTGFGSAVYEPQLWRNDGVAAGGEVVFARAPFPAPTYPASQQGGDPYGETLSWADADADGDMDALVATHAGTTLYRNDGSGTFVDSGQALPPYREFWTYYMAEPASSAWADVDNDGDLDLALPRTRPPAAPGSFPDTRVVLYHNDAGTLTAADSTSLPRVERDAQLTWGDVEGDGDLDLLYLSGSGNCANSNSGTGECLVIYQNDGGTLTPRPIDFPGFQGGAADFGDFDLDGDLDVLLVGSLSNPDGPPYVLDRAVVFRNDGATFVADTLQFPFAFDDYFQSVTGGRWADYDSDGDMDLLIGADVNDYSGPGVDFGGVAFVFTNEGSTGGGSPTFTLTAALPAPRSFGTATWADFDGDGDLDFLTTGRRVENGLWTEFARLYRNGTPENNAAPSAPSGLAATATADGAALAWAPATDDHTPSAALTYNLHVRRGDGQDVVSPHARGGGGRLVPEPGNVSLNRTWSLRDLAPGEYSWAVQAVDNAFNGGPFAEGGTFIVGTVAGEAAPAGPAVLALGPNPTVGDARVTLVLPASARTTVEVFDALGRRVAVLADAHLAAGDHAWPLAAARLAPGAYTVRVRLDGDTPTVLVGRLTVVR